MDKTTVWILRIASVALCLNAVLVLLKPRLREETLEQNTTPYEVTLGHGEQLNHERINCSCAEDNGSEPILMRTFVNYSVVATEIPQIGPTIPDTLSRLGTQLKFDYAQQCPEGSLMLDPAQRTAVPDHLDCPTLFIVGARKGGTTSLYQYLSMHPHFHGVNLGRGPTAGETFYFSAHYGKEDWSWSRYTQLFHVSQNKTGDASVGNLVHCDVPKRIWRSCGKQAKIVILLRDPIRRFVSNYLMRTKLGIRQFNNNTQATIAVKVEMDAFFSVALSRGVSFTNVAKSWAKFRCLFPPSKNMVFEGLYFVHVMNWLCNFPLENILIVNSEEFFANTTVILQQVVHFLGLDPLDHETAEVITSTIYNKGIGPKHNYQILSPLDTKKLVNIYKYANKALVQLLDWNSVEWSL